MKIEDLDMLDKMMGERSPTAKLNCEKVATIKKMLWKGNKPKVIAGLFGVSPDIIRAIKNHKSWQYVKIRNTVTKEWFW